MEGFSSMFTSSTNSGSASSSSTTANFPFSLNNCSGAFDRDYYDYDHHHIHHNQNDGHLVNSMMMKMAAQQQQDQEQMNQQRRLSLVPLVIHQSHSLVDVDDNNNGHVSFYDPHHNYQDDGKVNDAAEMRKEKKGTSVSEKKIKKHRYAFQTRSQVDILDDGYRWRKYGQKAVKNNKFPRSYYRCTHQGCNVKKQVQRLSKDEGVVVTTYEGIHSHPIEKSTDNFEHILTRMQIYTSF